jgi:hypothetical protein
MFWEPSIAASDNESVRTCKPVWNASLPLNSQPSTINQIGTFPRQSAEQGYRARGRNVIINEVAHFHFKRPAPPNRAGC